MKFVVLLGGVCLGDKKFVPPKPRTKGEVCLGLSTGISVMMEKTRKSNFGGGNTKWEEKSLGKWATSETRLIEVVENACGGGYGQLDLASMDMHKAGKNADCYSMLEQNEEWIEEWFEADPDSAADGGDFYQAFCVAKKKTNCKSKTAFGPKCRECPKGRNDQVCSGHGSCLGASDKQGKGGCECRDHWVGLYCQDCHEDFFEKNDECVKCHESCKTCNGPTTKDCKACGADFTPMKMATGEFSCRRKTSDEKYTKEKEEL